MRDGERGAEFEGADLEVAHAVERVAAVLQCLERPPRVRQERRSHLGQPHAAAVALEQRLAEVAFERLDARRHRRLGEEQRLRCLAEAAVLRHLYERFDLSEIHGLPRGSVAYAGRPVRSSGAAGNEGRTIGARYARLGRIGAIYSEASLPPKAIDFKMKRRSPDAGIAVQDDLGERARADGDDLRRYTRQRRVWSAEHCWRQGPASSMYVPRRQREPEAAIGARLCHRVSDRVPSLTESMSRRTAEPGGPGTDCPRARPGTSVRPAPPLRRRSPHRMRSPTRAARSQARRR